MYFVTICTVNCELLFGEVVEEEMRYSRIGQIVVDEWKKTAEIRPTVELDEFMVMPNHFHGIVAIGGDGAGVVGAHSCAPLRLQRQPRSLGSIVGGFKSTATSRVNTLRQIPGTPVWQRNYHEHVVRDENDLHRIREYIQTNPLRWELDRENPKRRGENEFDKWLERTTQQKKNRP
jgi:putative transposase